MKPIAAAVLLTVVASAGCFADEADPAAARRSVEASELAVVAFVNDHARVDVATLDDDCALRSDAARNIVAHRDGADAVAGTGDDDRFNDLAELDGVARVGPKTLADLAACADRHGYTPSDEDVRMLVLLNDADTATVRFLDIDCQLRSDAARNLVAHRDGADAAAGTADDNPFQSAAEVDGVARVGSATIAALRACAAADVELPWSPEHVEPSITIDDPGARYWLDDTGAVFVDGDGVPRGARLTVGFDGHTLTFERGPRFFNVSRIDREVPEGYGAAYLGATDAVTSFAITRDPAGTLSSGQALANARSQMVAYLRDVRIHEPDWQDVMPATWQDAVNDGILDDIARFGDDGQIARRPDHYVFAGTGPLGLYTEAHVSKSTGAATHFYVEID